MEVQIGGLIGLYGGLLCGLAGWYFGRKKAKKQRVLDETHEHIWHKARSYSWYVTIAAIYVLFTLYAFGFTLSVVVVLSMLMLVQMASWGIIGAVLSAIMYSGTEIKVSYFLVGIIVIIISAVVFLILTLLTENWLYLLNTIPFSIVGYLFIRHSKQQIEH